MKRLDLVISERELPAVLKAIDGAGAPGYTVMKHVTGRGPHGSVSESMDFSGLGANAHVLVFCEDEVLEKLRESLKPLLSYFGGMAYVSEATPL
ncbi:MAG: P-II family nitrogen regulator [Vulcanococcus sp.]|jgi:nitrogen regulatory protein PII